SAIQRPRGFSAWRRKALGKVHLVNVAGRDVRLGSLQHRQILFTPQGRTQAPYRVGPFATPVDIVCSYSRFILASCRRSSLDLGTKPLQPLRRPLFSSSSGKG